MNFKRIVLLTLALGIPLSSCGYTIAIQSTDTTTTSTTTTSTPRTTLTTISLGISCTSSNYDLVHDLFDEVDEAWDAATEDGVPTTKEWQAKTRALRAYRSAIRNLNIPRIAIEQNAFVYAIANYVEAYNRYWESGKKDLSVNDYITPYSDAENDFWRVFDQYCMYRPG